ncbi:MAG: TonB-dependent receptor [Bacteroidetes bacterium]|nr:TonB-dependent receptor [Bacteroidota bacterium]
MKIGLLSAALLLFACNCLAQLSGKVIEASTKEKIPGAVVSVEGTFLVAATDADGNFSFPQLTGKPVRMHISHIGFENKVIEMPLPNVQAEIFLVAKTYLSDEVMVTATRAADKSPTAFSALNKTDLEKNNMGQDMPFLLNMTPSAVVTSDAGAGVGYTGIRIRGSDPTRVNVTINGIPINDAEENGLYWVDLPDFASSVDNIQIQRGIGTSTNGAGAFGGSVNILSSTLSHDPFATISESYGSFNTWKNTLNFGTGLLKNKIAVEGRLSKINSDGYVDRATSDLKSFFLSGGYYGSKSTLRAIVFSGKEKTYQSWYGIPEDSLKIPEDSLKTNRNYNPAGEYYDANGGIHYYDNQTDNYRQDYYQLHYSFAATEHLMLNAALHYTKGIGYYEEYQGAQLFSDYKLEDVIIGTDTITSTDLIRQKWLDNDFYGFTFSSIYETEKLQFTFGGAGNRYTGRHFDQIIWAQFSSNGAKDFVYNDNDATKNDFNVFAKAIYSLNPRLHFFTDIQYRMVNYSFLGFDESLRQGQQEAKHNFFNPKAGITFELDRKNIVYGSIAIGNKEPIRKDYTESSSASRPKSEQMTDIEAGYKFSGDRIRLGANFYLMNYKDQLILTGQINDVGEYTRMNVPESSRMGVEIEAGWSLLKSLSVNGNLTMSQNKIKKFNEYVDDYDAGGQQVIAHRNTDIAFSPSVISAGTISWLPVKNLSIDLTTKYVGRQYLDNTSDETRKLDAYLLNDFLLQYHFSFSFCKEITLRFAVYNLFDQIYESNGYTYGYVSGGSLVQENFYYPQAGRSWMGGVAVKF